MKNSNRLIYLLAVIKFIFPFLVQDPLYQPHRDEFLYLAEGRHMAWGFMEVPPVLSVFAWLTHILGDTMFWLKCWPSLFGALTYILTGRIILSLGGKAFALFLGFLPFILGAYLRVHYLFQPNFLEIFFWTMIAWSMIRYVQTSQNKWLYVFGIAVGFGMLSKYSVLFFVVSVLIGIALTPQRKIYTNKHLYYAALLAFLIFLPNLLWQYSRHFPVAFHMKKLQRTQLQYISPSSFLIDQLIMNLPVVFIWIAGLLAVFFSRQLKTYRFLGWAYLSVIALLLAGHGKNYYSLGVYPALFAFGAFQLEQLTMMRSRLWRYAFVFIPLLFAYAIIPVALPIFKPGKLDAFYRKNDIQKFGVLRWEDGDNHQLPQDFSDMLGWEEMARKTAAAYNTLDSNEKKNAIIFCDNYGEAGAVNFYADKYHLPFAYSDDASFLYWMPDNLRFDNLVLLTDDQHEMEHPFIKDFTSAVLVDSVADRYARESGTLIIVLKNGNADFKNMFIQKIEKDKRKVSF